MSRKGRKSNFLFFFVFFFFVCFFSELILGIKMDADLSKFDEEQVYSTYFDKTDDTITMSSFDFILY